MVYPIGKILLPPIYKLWLRQVTGLENIPKDKPFIIAANHASYYDTLLIPVLIVQKINKQMRGFADSLYWNNFFSKIILDWGGSIPVHIRGQKGAKKFNKKSFKRAIDYLKNGGILQIYPEGTRSHDGKLKKAYPGVGKLAKAANVPVLPFGIIDSYKVIPKGKILPRLKRAEVRIGKLMYFKNKTDEQITRKIMKQIAKLIGQKYDY